MKKRSEAGRGSRRLSHGVAMGSLVRRTNPNPGRGGCTRTGHAPEEFSGHPFRGSNLSDDRFPTVSPWDNLRPPCRGSLFPITIPPLGDQVTEFPSATEFMDGHVHRTRGTEPIKSRRNPGVGGRKGVTGDSPDHSVRRRGPVEIHHVVLDAPVAGLIVVGHPDVDMNLPVLSP